MFTTSAADDEHVQAGAGGGNGDGGTVSMVMRSSDWSSGVARCEG